MKQSAAIKRATQKARNALKELDLQSVEQLLLLYRRAAEDVRQRIFAAADAGQQVPQHQLQPLLAQIQGVIDRLHALASAHEITSVWPGHGPVIPSALDVLDFYIAHRRERLAQVRDALRSLHASARAGEPLDHAALPRRIVELVYADVDPVLWPAAELSVRAQLDYLRR